MEASLSVLDGPLLEALALDTATSVADLACGGGGTTLEISRRAPTGCRVAGFDISARLVELARARAVAERLDIAFDVVDIASARPPAPFARLSSRFGIMFFDDPGAAFANLTHWLEPGGRFAFAVWGPREESAWQTEVRSVVAELVELPHVDPDAPGPFRYADPAPLLRLLEQAGFHQPAVRSLRTELPIGGGVPAAEAARFALSAFSSFGEALAGAGEAAQREAQRRLALRFADHERNGAVRLGACIHLVTGTRA
jgi:SAM-dependent methyltransferase